MVAPLRGHRNGPTIILLLLAVPYSGSSFYVEFVKDRLKLREKDKMLTLTKAELVPNRADEAEKISRTKYVPISDFLGLFLSIAYITGRYCWKLTKKQ